MSRTVHHLIRGLEALPHARVVIERFLDGQLVSKSSRAEVLLVMSELVTNGFVHARADEVRIAITLGEESTSLEIEVEHALLAAPDIPERPAPLPPPDVLTGRGMAIVDRLTDRREVHLSDDQLAISCTVRLS